VVFAAAPGLYSDFWSAGFFVEALDHVERIVYCRARERWARGTLAMGSVGGDNPLPEFSVFLPGGLNRE
jgi:hypothetical protein